MDPLAFAVERYNYWIFITLMMMGLFIVIARGNLIKKLIGLNVFQTSVFIFYISMGKIAGGTAPIYVAGDMEARAHGEGNGAQPPLPGKSEIGAGAIHADDGLHDGFDLAGNDLATLTGKAKEAPAADAIHSAPAGGANDIFAPPLKIEDNAAAEAIRAATDVIYSNPLPHVLILTAIVVGIATTAVGLALVVRIREAYGAIEEDELEAADDIAEFGHVPNAEGVRA
ncbi:MAG: cation:proton antiporter subunit C [Pseudomonadota bacterium]